MRDAVWMLRQGGQGFTLLRCAGDAWVIKLGTGGDLPKAFLARLGRFALAQQHWQCPAQGVAEAVLVILRGPQAQLEQRRRQRRFVVQYRDGRLELLGGHLAVVNHLDQDADQLAAAKRHPYPHAGLQRATQYSSRSAVVE